MNYCCIVWSGTDKTDDLDRIHKIQKRYCRLITFSNTRAHAAPLFKILKFFTIYQMYTYHVLLFMYKNLNNIGPGVLFSFQMNIWMFILTLHANSIGCILLSVEHVPGNALFTIRAQKYGMTSRMIYEDPPFQPV